MSIKKIKKAIFPVGGLGTRFLPVTKSLPKEMLPVASKPLIQHVFEEAQAAGIEQFIFVTGRNKNAISNHFDHSYELQNILSDKNKQQELSLTKSWLPKAGHVAFVRQQEPLGLGHAVWCARNFIGDEPFAVLLADEMLKIPDGFLKQMIELYNEVGGNIIALAEIDKRDSCKYGIVAGSVIKGDVIEINNMVEKPQPEVAPSNLSITGRYILQPKIFDHLAQATIGVGGELQLTDAMAELLKSADFYGLKFKGERFDCGNQVGFLEANLAYALADDSLNLQVKQMLKKYCR